MSANIILPEIDNIIICYLSLADFMNMRQVNHYFNNTICNTKLNCMHTIKLDGKTHEECTQTLGHIKNLYCDYGGVNIHNYKLIHHNIVNMYVARTDFITDGQLNKLTNITRLAINNNTISDEGIKDLINIQSLTITDARVSNNGVKHLAGLTNLLVIGTSMVTDEIREYFPSTVNIKILNF